MSLLAQIIAGEAQHGSTADSYGVAATIYNRTNSPAFTAYGSTPLAQATARGQFSAYPNALGTPTPYQQTLADSLESGTFASQGNPGNATYYNGAGGSSYSAYASVPGAMYGSGSNAYSDQYGRPADSNFVLPVAGGTPGSDGVAPNGNGSGYGVLTMNPADPNYGDITNLPVAGVNAPAAGGAGAATGTGAPGNDQGTPNLGGGASSGGLPTDTGNAKPTDVPTAIASGFNHLTGGFGDVVTAATGSITKTITDSTTAALKAGTGWLDSTFANLSQWLERIGLGMLAIVLIGLAIVLIAFNSRKSGAQPINITLAAVP